MQTHPEKQEASSFRALFVCSRNRLRSPTGEALLQGLSGVSSASCGTAPDAEEPASLELVDWADAIFAMEGRHKKALLKKFPHLGRKGNIRVLGIPDDFDFMAPELAELIASRVSGLLPPQAQSELEQKLASASAKRPSGP